jgi:hypothetical protein
VVADLDCFLQRGRRAAGAGAGGDVLRVHDVALDLLQNNTNRGREEVRLDKVKGIEEREGWGSLAVPKSTGNTCRYAGLRRGILQSSLRLERRSKRGEGEDTRGYL